MNFYLGLDMGTTGVKAAVFDAFGNMAGVGLTEYTLETPAPDIVELDAEIYWDSARSAIAEAVENAAVAPENIVSVAITGQAETLIMVGVDGKPLRKAIVWLDNRASDEARELNERFGQEELFRLSGQTEMLPCWKKTINHPLDAYQELLEKYNANNKNFPSSRKVGESYYSL